MRTTATAVSLLLIASPQLTLGDDICVTGVTLSGFTVNADLNGDYIGDGRTDRISSSFMWKDGAAVEQWLTYDSNKHSGAERAMWAIWTYADKETYRGKTLLAYCVPGVDGCPEGVPSTNDGGRIWPTDAGANGPIQWNVMDSSSGEAQVRIDSEVQPSCCEWTVDKCDSCKCSSGKLKFWCDAGCGEECCFWHCDRVTGLFCSCIQSGIKRHCQHESSPNATLASEHGIAV